MSMAITPARSALDDIGPRRPPQMPRSDATRVWAGVVLVLAALGLVGLGGGALAGVLELLRMQTNAGGASHGDVDLLRNVLYCVAGACFLAAVVVLSFAVRGLCRIMKERAAAE